MMYHWAIEYMQKTHSNSTAIAPAAIRFQAGLFRHQDIADRLIFAHFNRRDLLSVLLFSTLAIDLAYSILLYDHMKNSAHVSFVIPVLNESKRIEACLDSIAAQTVKPLEVIVVDNGSSDNTASLAAAYPFVTVLHEPERGIVFARNKGFNVAKGDYIARIDADTRLFPNWTARMLKLADERQDSALTGGGLPRNYKLPRLFEWLHIINTFWGNRLALGGKDILWGSNQFMPRKLWEDVKYDVCLRTDIHEDLDLAIHLHKKHHKVFFERKVIVSVDVRDISNYRQARKHMQMWPRTMHVHHKLWAELVSWVGYFVILYLYRPFEPLLRKRSSE